MEKQPFFTIGIPVYNTEKWIGECLDSILSQDFTDFEIICVNDGSTDNSLQILNEYSAKDTRVKVLSRTNDGAASARNFIISSACGQYINFLDSDDFMCKDALAYAHKFITENNCPDLLETGYYRLDNNTLSLYVPKYPGDEYFKTISKDERAVKMWLDKTYVPSTPAKYIKRDFLYSKGIYFNPQYVICEDSDFTFRMHQKADTIIYGDFPSFTYRIGREGSAITTLSAKAMYSSLSYEQSLYSQCELFALSADVRNKLEARKLNSAAEARDYTISMLSGNISRQQALAIAGITEQIFAPYLKNLPLTKGKSGVIFILYKIFGIKRTVSLLYSYLSKKGVITHE